MGRRQTGCGRRQVVAYANEAMTVARRLHDDEGDPRSPLDAPGAQRRRR